VARFTVELPVPPRVAFDYLADPRHRPEWQSSLVGVELFDAGPPGVGTRWVDRTAVGARPRLEIVELTPPGADGEGGAWSEVGAWRGLRARLRLTFAQGAGDGTVLGVHVQFDSSRRWLPVRLVLQTLAPFAVRRDLRRAARILG
jgi:uncharacterized protein YndB with AHSA1/START domain